MPGSLHGHSPSIGLSVRQAARILSAKEFLQSFQIAREPVQQNYSSLKKKKKVVGRLMHTGCEDSWERLVTGQARGSAAFMGLVPKESPFMVPPGEPCRSPGKLQEKNKTSVSGAMELSALLGQRTA